MKQKDQAPNETAISSAPLTGSRKVYIPGKLHNIKVAMREITLTDTVHKFNGSNKIEKNPSITVYDTSGPYTDTNYKIDLKQGLPRLREEWILNRGDVQQETDFSSEYCRKRLADTSLDHLRF